MADPEHLNNIMLGSAAWNAWRRANPNIKPDLTSAALVGCQLGNLRLANADLSLATLSKANLRGADCWRTDLTLAELSGSNLSRSYFGRACLHSANLSGTDLSTTRFIGTDLSCANLSNTKIFHAHFIDTDLTGTDFSNAWIKETAFSNVDLSQAKGLDSVKMIGPSSLGIDSIYRSSGQIPTGFLRGCGVPEEFIHTIPMLKYGSAQHFSCFLSHSRMDRVFCDKVFGDLQANGIRCWYFPEDIATGGMSWTLKNDVSRSYDKLLVICSKHSLRNDAVVGEIERALESENRDGRTILHCITRDDFLGNEWSHPGKSRLMETLSADFRNWESRESYARSLGKLLKALKQD